MKKSILITAAVLALAGCQSGDPQLKKASVDKVLKAMTLEEKVHFVIGMGMAGMDGSSAVVGATEDIVPGAAGTTYPIPRLFPGAGGLVEGSQFIGAHLQGEGLALAGLQFLGLAEGLQLTGGLVQTTGGSAHIEFHYFLAGYGTGIGNGDGSGEAILIGLYDGLGISKGGIAEAIAEGIGNGHVTGNEMTVTHPDRNAGRWDTSTQKKSRSTTSGAP